MVYDLKVSTKLFADDTTVYKNYNLKFLTPQSAINDFCLNLGPILKWCKFNKLNINWEKTIFMFISYKKYNFPSLIFSEGNDVCVVESFKLLGVTKDNEMNFYKHVSCTLKAINTKLYSIKKVFYLFF